MQYIYNLLWNAVSNVFQKEVLLSSFALEVSFSFCATKRQSFLLSFVCRQLLGKRTDKIQYHKPKSHHVVLLSFALRRGKRAQSQRLIISED